MVYENPWNTICSILRKRKKTYATPAVILSKFFKQCNIFVNMNTEYILDI